MVRKCFLCEETRSLDRAHILPRHIIKEVQGIRRYAKFEGNKKGIIILCKNHHFLFDHFKLNDDEWFRLLVQIKKQIGDVLLDVLNSSLTPKKEKDIIGKGKMVMRNLTYKRRFERWQTRIGVKLVQYKIFDFYGSTKELQEMQKA